MTWWDHDTGSIWSQPIGEAIMGERKGATLELLPSTLTTWKKWRNKYPQAQVLSFDTGYSRNYSSDPYLDYYERQSGFRSFFKLGPGEKEKELVVGIVVDGQAKAYPLSTIKNSGPLKDMLAGLELSLNFDKSTDSLSVIDAQGNSVEQMTVYWFVWKAIWPRTERF
jgi:hypothetical protein